MEVKYSVYDILEINNKQYRILAIQPVFTSVIELNTTKMNIMALNNENLTEQIEDGVCTVTHEESNQVLDISSLPPKALEDFKRKQSLIAEIKKLYEPSFIDLGIKSRRPVLDSISNKYSFSHSQTWRIVTRYLQSGCKDISLIDRRRTGYNSPRKEYQYKKHAGRIPTHEARKNLFSKEELNANFEEALERYISGRQKTLKGAYEYMLRKHYSTEITQNGTLNKVLVPPEQRPSFTQFYYLIAHMKDVYRMPSWVVMV